MFISRQFFLGMFNVSSKEVESFINSVESHKACLCLKQYYVYSAVREKWTRAM